MISDKQKELDRIKWEKSVRLGFDACGTFDFCRLCDKTVENPCESAHNKFYGVDIPSEHEVVIDTMEETLKVETPKTEEAKKTTKAKSTAVSKTKSLATKKSSAKKKTTTKKTTKKSTTKKATAKSTAKKTK